MQATMISTIEYFVLIWI